ncbi:TetR family transcriptional regulator [Corynebacterium callunae]|uniref:TetR family transcriptional regulator n=1 Tax=Corynebacterium callunae TaxID=1721 RepID=UPI003981A56A
MQLNKESITDAAISLLNAYGLSDMTMRRVAKQLEVAPGALYWHFKNKQELVDATARRILAPLLEPDVQGRVEKRNAQDTCAQLRALMISHRDGAEVVSAALSSPTLRTELETLIAGALDTPDEIGAFTLLHFVVGAVLAEQTQLQLQELTGEEGEKVDFEQRFSTGVQIIIVGLDAIRDIR